MRNVTAGFMLVILNKLNTFVLEATYLIINK
jgi:hypothetical protein